MPAEQDRAAPREAAAREQPGQLRETGRTRSAGNGPVTGRGRGPGTEMPATGRAPEADGVPARAYVAMAEVYEHMFDKQRGGELPENRALVARPWR